MPAGPLEALQLFMQFHEYNRTDTKGASVGPWDPQGPVEDRLLSQMGVARACAVRGVPCLMPQVRPLSQHPCRRVCPVLCLVTSHK